MPGKRTQNGRWLLLSILDLLSCKSDPRLVFLLGDLSVIMFHPTRKLRVRVGVGLFCITTPRMEVALYLESRRTYGC